MRAVHPIERLRWVARAGDVDAASLVQESAGALAGLGDDPGDLLLSCRRLLARHPASGPLWSLCARMLTSADCTSEGYRYAAAVDDDPTSRVLAGALPDESRITVLGWPDLIGEALRRNGDVEVLVIDARGEGSSFARRLQSVDIDAEPVEESGLGAAASRSSVVVLETSAMGPTGFLAVPGSLAAAAVARTYGVPVWLVAGEGRVLPARLWEALLRHLPDVEAWDAADELVPLELVDTVIRPAGALDVAAALAAPDCPSAPELQGEDH
ncbi:MAG: hypothetical protein QOI47_2161 [Actinomycetota bacterium]|nr:hypothetical protein [Actinomycetota bacterium]